MKLTATLVIENQSWTGWERSFYTIVTSEAARDAEIETAVNDEYNHGDVTVRRIVEGRVEVTEIVDAWEYRGERRRITHVILDYDGVLAETTASFQDQQHGLTSYVEIPVQLIYDGTVYTDFADEFSFTKLDDSQRVPRPLRDNVDDLFGDEPSADLQSLQDRVARYLSDESDQS